MSILEKLKTLGLELPPLPKPVGNYRPAKRIGSLVFTSGQTARTGDARRYVGKVGAGVSDEEAYLSARDAVLNCLACAGSVAGGVDNLKQVIKVLGFVNCVEGYGKQPAVINGASDLIEKLFGEAGAHARSAIGVNALPSNASVEIEMVFALE